MELPSDVITEILTRFPVKSLLKFTSVCRSWLSLISSKQFIEACLRKEDSKDSTRHRVMLNCSGNLKQCSLSSLLHEPVVDAFDTSYLVQFSRRIARLVGCCNGLICFVIEGKVLILWNPSTRKFKQLPDSGVKVRLDSFACGLGFDKRNDDYKVVVFLKSRTHVSENILKVYSLKSDQWRRIKNFESRRLMDPVTFANGKLYWIAFHWTDLESGWDIVSLDLETNEHVMVPMPDNVKSGSRARMGACEGCLYVLCSHETGADVWILDDDKGVGKGSWSKVVSMSRIDKIFDSIKVLYVQKNGKVALLCGSRVLIIDSKDCSYRYAVIRNLRTCYAVGTYVSLVSPFG